MNQFPEPDEALDLVLSTRLFSMLVNSGTSLVRSMLVLQQQAQPRLASVWREVQAEVERGQVLSRALREKAAVFSPFYVAMVRAGEVGGVLDETLSRTADMLEEEWELSRSLEAAVWTPLLLPAAHATPRDWAALSEYQQKLTLLLLCRAWSLLLSSGVPIIHTLQIAAELLPTAQRDALRDDVVRELREGTPLSAALATLNFLPPLILELWQVGERNGNVDVAMEKAAQFYRYELSCRLGLAPGNATNGTRALDIAVQIGRPRLAEMDAVLQFFTDELSRREVQAEAMEDAYDENRYLWAQITPLANRILKLALAMQASEIHLDEIHLEWKSGRPGFEDGESLLNFRIDGELREQQRMSSFLGSQLTYHFGVMAGIQGQLREGTIHLRHDGQPYELHVTNGNPLVIVINRRA